MEACDTRVLGQIRLILCTTDEMESMFRSYHVYKSVWLPVVGEQLVLEKEPANQSTQ